MTVNTQQFDKIGNIFDGIAMVNKRQAIYEEAELKYGPGFAQYCADVLTEGEESPEPRPASHQHMTDLIRLTAQLHSLSQVCQADFFQTWGTEDKQFFMNVLTSVSNDLSIALQGSLEEVSVRNQANTRI